MIINDLRPQIAINRAYWTGYSGSLPHADLPIYRTGLPHRLLNGVLRVRGLPAGRAVAEAREQLNGTRWGWWVHDDSDPGTAEALLANGAHELNPLPIMAIDLLKFVAPPAPGTVTINRVTTGEQLRKFVETCAEPIGVPADAVDDMVKCETAYASSEGRRLIRLIATVDDRTVGTAAVFLGSRVAAVYWVATDPAFRKRGIATALTTETLRLARRNGLAIATLQASSVGEPIYRQIGFADVGHYRRFTL